MDQEPEFYVSPEDLEAQMTADERGEGHTGKKQTGTTVTQVHNNLYLFLINPWQQEAGKYQEDTTQGSFSD